MLRSRLVVIITVAVVALIAVGLFNVLPGLSASGQAQESIPTALLEMPELTPSPTLAPIPTTAISTDPQLASVPLYENSFDDEAALESVETVDLALVAPDDKAVWDVIDGHLVQNGVGRTNDANIRETLAVFGEQDWTNYTVSAKAYNQFNATFGLVARYQDENNFYRYRTLANSFEDTPKQVLEKVVDGVATPLFTIEQPGHDEYRWYNVSLSVVGDTISVTLDGKIIAEVRDNSLDSGRAGVYTRALGDILFDDVTVTSR